jgi:hypothetical protein
VKTHHATKARSVQHRLLVILIGSAMLLAAACSSSNSGSSPTPTAPPPTETVSTSPTETASSSPSPTAEASSQPSATTGTEVVHFIPARPPDSTAEDGSCFANSIAAPGRTDAWRCSVGNAINDPCFSIDAQTMVCGADPSKSEPGFLLTLTEPLPAPDVPQAAIDAAATNGWLVRLADGTVCNFATGATGGIGDKRANYACADQRWLLGDLTPGTPYWTADAATISVGPNGWQADTRETVNVAIVWQ